MYVCILLHKRLLVLSCLVGVNETNIFQKFFEIYSTTNRISLFKTLCIHLALYVLYIVFKDNMSGQLFVLTVKFLVLVHTMSAKSWQGVPMVNC